MGRVSTQVDLTTGPTFGKMLAFSMPIMLQGSFQILYNLVDRFWVGQLGKEAMAAVSVGFPVIFFMISLVIGISIGAGVMISQFRGADKPELTNLTARNFLVVGTIAVVVVSVWMLTGVEYILTFLGTPEDFFADAVLYLRWIFGGLIFFFSYNAATGIFRGLGDSVKPVIVAAISTLLNIVLDPMFINGWGPLPAYGVQGAGIATVLANAIGAVIIFILLAKEKHWVDLTPRDFRFDMGIIREMFRLGLPSTATNVMVSFSVMIVMRFVNGLGTAAVAAFGIGIVLDSLIMMPAQSFSMSMSNIAGQNMGAGKPERVGMFLRDTLMLSVGIAISAGLFLVLGVSWITRIFQPDPSDYQEILPLMTIYVRIMAVRYLMMAMFFPIIGTIRGAGDAMASMFLVIFTQLIIRIPTVILLVPIMGFAGIAWSLAFSTIFGFTISAIYYRSGKWMTKCIAHKNYGMAASESVANVE